VIFRQATIRLTLLFTIILLLLFGAFGVGVYVFVISSFDYDTAASTGSNAVDAAEQSFADLRFGLLIGYLALVVIVPIVCYLMVRLVLRPAKRGFEAQQRFVDDASHEFRTPLSIIQGELELAISRPRSHEDYQSAIITALDEVDHLNTLTNDLLLLSRSNKTELSAAFQPVELRSIVERAVATHARGPMKDRIELRTVDVMVLGSEILLVQAFGNILDNAVKFSPPGAPIRVTLAQHGERAQVAVQDAGSGLTAEQQSHAFDRFWRSEESRTLPGRGLGLALVKQIVDVHRGSVGLQSDGNSGTCVTIELPIFRG
jgi:signal transduction histidine kinase